MSKDERLRLELAELKAENARLRAALARAHGYLQQNASVAVMAQVNAALGKEPTE